MSLLFSYLLCLRASRSTCCLDFRCATQSALAVPSESFHSGGPFPRHSVGPSFRGASITVQADSSTYRSESKETHFRIEAIVTCFGEPEPSKE